METMAHSCFARPSLSTTWGPVLVLWPHRGAARFLWSEVVRQAPSVLSLLGAGVAPLVLAGEVEAPVLFEVAVAGHRAEGEDGFGAVQSPSGAADVEAVGAEVPGMLPR
jgi:hypothetical protein